MKVDPMRARETGPPVGESADGLPKPEPACEMPEGSGLDPLGSHFFFEDDLDTVGCESDREVVSLATEHLPHYVDTGIEVVQLREGVFQARFTLQLASVSSAALATDHARWSESGTIVQGEAARQRALASLACSLQPSQCVRFDSVKEQTGGSVRTEGLIEALSTATPAAVAV